MSYTPSAQFVPMYAAFSKVTGVMKPHKCRSYVSVMINVYSGRRLYYGKWLLHNSAVKGHSPLVIAMHILCSILGHTCSYVLK